MNKFISHLLLTLVLLCSANGLRAEIIVVDNVSNAGTGSLRDAIGSASFSANDTVLINVKGTIELTSPIPINNFTALTIIGPYPKHNRITHTGPWTGAYFNIVNSENVTIQGLGFTGGNGNSRHVLVSGGGPITFIQCAFEGSNLIAQNGGSVTIASGGEAVFKQCSFIANSAVVGGAIFATGNSNLTVENCTFAENVASSNGGAINLSGSVDARIVYSTFRNNSSGGNSQAIRATGGTSVTVENLAVAENGSGRQVRLNGSVANEGGNRFLLNTLPLLEDEGISPAGTGDGYYLAGVLGLKSTLVENGFGLKYYPIVNGASFLINPVFVSVTTPLVDCKNAPRSLKGSGTDAFPDAGASEYTHLRVTNTSGDKSIANSFLWALEAAQQKDDVHYIEFDIPGVAGHDILFDDEGKVKDEVYIIDGFSQNGSAIPGPNQLGFVGLTEADIQINFIDGSGNGHGVKFDAGSQGSTIQGVSIQDFEDHGLETNVDNVTIFGCEVGFDATNTFGKGIGRVGLKVNGSDNIIGGWEHWMRNVISANGFDGTEEMNVLITDGSERNIFYGNIIGGAPNGVSLIGGFTTPYGIYASSADVQFIGNALINTGNIIVGNEYGIYLERAADFLIIQGNKIGIGWDSSTALGNTEAGIFLFGSDDNLIGGKAEGQGNIIAHNETGIALVFDDTEPINNSILGNLIYSNLGQGIDFDNNNAVLANDGAFSGTHPNFGIDHPELISSSNCAGGNTITTYSLSVPNTGLYRVEFFSSTSPDPTNGEGEFFRGFQVVNVTTNPQTFTYTHDEVLPTQTVTATVTRESNGVTSEFGTNVLVDAVGGSPTISYDDICFGETAVPNTFDPGGTFRFEDPAPAEATIDPATGEITGGLEGSTYSVIYSFAGCSSEDTTTFDVIDVDESFVFPDFCPETVGSPSSVAVAGEFDIITPIDGASITDAGDLSDGVEGTTYNIRHIAELLGCKDTSFELVQVIPTDATFSFPDFCGGAPSPAPVAATSGGTFSFSGASPVGTSINGTTGVITGADEGDTFNVRYVVGPCSKEEIVTVNVINVDASFVFDDFCPGTIGIATSIAVAGEFDITAPIDGATITDAGELTGGVEGTTYTIRHIANVAGCADTSFETALVTPTDESFTFADFCAGASSPAPIAATGGGTYSFSTPPPAGVTINSTTGVISDSNEGDSYSISYVVGTCSEEFIVTVNVITTDATFIFPDFCGGAPSPAPTAATPGGTYNFSDAVPIGVTIDPATGVISGANEGDTFNVRYVVGVCAKEFIQTVNTVTTDESFIFPDFCPLGPSTPTSISTPGGTFSFNTPPGGSTTIDGTTGEIFLGVEGVTYDVLYTVGTCSESSLQTPAVIEVLENFTFDDFCIDNDSSATGPIADNLDSSNFYLLEPSFGATINPATGIIYDVDPLATYTVIDSATNGVCWQTDTAVVSPLFIDPVFTMENFCEYDTGFAVFNTPGSEGVMSFYIAPDDLPIIEFDSILYNVTAGNSYYLNFTTEIGICVYSSNVTVSVFDPNAAFSMNDFCPGADSDAPFDYVLGGSFSFSDPAPTDGEIIDPVTGIISNALEDSIYVVQHIVEQGGCFDTASVEVYVQYVPEEFSIADFCWQSTSEDPTFISEGTWSFGSPGPAIDDDVLLGADGIISSAMEDTLYEIVHTLTVAGCTQSDSIEVLAFGVDESFTMDDFCSTTVGPPATPVATPGGTFTFGAPLEIGDLASIDPVTGAITNGTEGNEYVIWYTVNPAEGPCEEIGIDTVNILGVDQSFVFNDFCAEFAGNVESVSTAGGTFSFETPPGGTTEIDATTGTIINAVPGIEYSIIYTVGECTESDTLVVAAFPSENATFTTTPYCANATLPVDITGTLGGNFAFNPSPSDAAEIDNLTGEITNATGGIYSIEYITTGTATTCKDTSVVTVEIYAVPEILTIDSPSLYCPDETIGILEASVDAVTTQVYWYESSTDNTISDSSTTYLPNSLNVGLNTFYAQPTSAEGCFGNFEEYTIKLSDTTGMHTIADFQVCLGSPAQLEVLGGVSYIWDTDILLSDNTSPNPTAFSLTPQNYAVTITNEDNCEVMDTLKVTFYPISECSINVYNAFSPNNDGTNDFWYIDNLINYMPNSVYIYNRWGDEVYSAENYDNINVYWDGTDKSGNPLPPGTYFYVVMTEYDLENKAAWVQLVR